MTGKGAVVQNKGERVVRKLLSPNLC